MVITVTEKQIDKVEENLMCAPECLKCASLALRSCYSTNAPSVKKITEYRDDIVDNVLVFKECLLPMSMPVMKNLKRFLDNYLALSMEDWKECLEDIADDAKSTRSNAIMSHRLTQICKSISQKQE